MQPLITLTTDFGTSDGYVGAMKGRIARICPDARIIDISHDIAPQNLMAGAWCLARACPEFPAASVHVAVIDPGVGSERGALAIEAGGHWFVGPDNGLFAEVLKTLEPTEVRRIREDSPDWQKDASFDGLALFSPVAAHLANGVARERIGPVAASAPMPLAWPRPERHHGRIQGEILMFDHFGNALTNIDAATLTHFDAAEPRIGVGEQTLALVDHYEAGRGQRAFALINSDGLLEIAVYAGNARHSLALRDGDAVTLTVGR